MLQKLVCTRLVNLKMFLAPLVLGFVFSQQAVAKQKYLCSANCGYITDGDSYKPEGTAWKLLLSTGPDLATAFSALKAKCIGGDYYAPNQLFIAIKMQTAPYSYSFLKGQIVEMATADNACVKI